MYSVWEKNHNKDFGRKTSADFSSKIKASFRALKALHEGEKNHKKRSKPSNEHIMVEMCKHMNTLCAKKLPFAGNSIHVEDAFNTSKQTD